MKFRFPKTRWHRLLAGVLREWLTPVGIEVRTEVPIGHDLPVADILLLCRQGGGLRGAQRMRLADGLRDSRATQLLLEFKYTESINEDAVLQVLIYETLHRHAEELKTGQLQSFLLSSRTPRRQVLDGLGYRPTGVAGVYRSGYRLISRVVLLVLNELSDAPRNVPLKCFASRRGEVAKAYRAVRGNRLPGVSAKLERLFYGLWLLLLGIQEKSMKLSEIEELTPELVMAVGEEWADRLLSALPPEERLRGLPPEERLRGLPPEERLRGLPPEERLRGLPPEERLKALSPEEHLQALSPEEHFKALASPETLRGLSKKQRETLKALLEGL